MTRKAKQKLFHEFKTNRVPRGFRLSKLEVFNWGTFDGAVHGINPRGDSVLLVGDNGTGKSTLVDALLTLLVRPNTRNYNVAAGASKTERDEKSYIQGAFDKRIDSTGAPKIEYLRPGNKHFSALLACFENVRTGRVFTICQVLFLDSNHKAKKIYAFDPLKERSIAEDLGGITDTASVLAELKSRGFETTDTYTRYFEWLRRATNFRPKAMDMFNQAAWVKDVQQLDAFVRDHMLEKKPWDDKVSQLLQHFNELSEAHRMLVQVRQQAELLQPIMAEGERFTDLDLQRTQVTAQLQATSLYFKSAAKQLLEPLCFEWRQRIADLDAELHTVSQRLTEKQDEAAQLRLDIKTSGNQRVQRLPDLIIQANERAEVRRSRRSRLIQTLQDVGVVSRLQTAKQHSKALAEASTKREEIAVNAKETRKSLRSLQYEIGQLRAQLRADQKGLSALEGRKSNVPQSLIDVREQMCRELKISHHDLPFAAELMAVAGDFQPWEASIEHVLRSFARDLLVPNKLYKKVSDYIDRSRLVDADGQGQSLSYSRIEPHAGDDPRPIKRQTLFSMLKFREHDLTPWLRSEIRRRFDYVACDSVEDFRKVNRQAMTQNRHTKRSRRHHQKDDRSTNENRLHFLLGWDNREKCRVLRENIATANDQLQTLRSQESELQTIADAQSKSLHAITEIEAARAFDEVDEVRYLAEAKTLQTELERLTSTDEKTTVLKNRLAQVEEEARQLDKQRGDLQGERRLKQHELAQGEKQCADAESVLDGATKDGSLQEARSQFESIENLLVANPLSVENIGTLPSEFQQTRMAELSDLNGRLEPIRQRVEKLMGQFLRKFPAFETDMTHSVKSLPEFQRLARQIQNDDLPKHESRFKTRLNEKVLTEVGLLKTHLENEREEIKTKIEEINQSLRRMEWRDNTHIRLEPADSSDLEIRDFRKELSSCLSGYVEGQTQADEQTFARIESIVNKLSDDKNTRWREKVIDVRRWFTFSAREIHNETSEAGSYYDGGTGQSGGEKARLAFLVLVAAIAYQYDIRPDDPKSDRFHFVVVDEMFSRTGDTYARYALDLFEQFGLQLLIVAPLDSKARVCEPYVGMHAHTVKNAKTNRSELLSLTTQRYEELAEKQATVPAKSK
ncbi:MAG: ATP-binding protein [Planctomycetaceae bacterium]